MLVYFAFYFLVGFSAYCSRSLRGRGKFFVCFLLPFAALLLIVGLRSPQMGVDLVYGQYFGYLGRFTYISNSSWGFLLSNSVQNYEIGYVFFNKLIGYISVDYNWLLTCVALVSLFPVFMVYWKYSDSFWLSIVIYLSLTCFLMVFSGLRQACAIGICFASYRFIKKRKAIPFVLMVLLAATFHKSAIVFLCAYPLYSFRIKRESRVFTLFLIAIVFVFRYQIFYVLAPIFQRSIEPDNNGALTLFLVFSAIYCFCFFFSKDDKEHVGLLNIFLVAVLIQSFAGVQNHAARMGYYFTPFLGLLLPKAIKNIPLRDRRIVCAAITVIFAAYGLYSIYDSGNSWPMAYPWRPFWSE